MRVWLKKMLQRESRRWEDREFEGPEAALLDWLTIPLGARCGGLLSEEGAGARKPSDAEVSIGLLLVSRPLSAWLRDLIRIEEPPERFRLGYPRVKEIRIGGRVFDERDVITDAEARTILAAIGSRAGGREGARGTARGSSGDSRARAHATRPASAEDVVDAEFVEVGAPAPDPAEAPGAAPRHGVLLPESSAYREALALCSALSPASGPAYKAACDEAEALLGDFLAGATPGAARKAARTAQGLVWAMPRHFPTAEAAGLWAMVARPAIAAYAESLWSWIQGRPLAALTYGGAAPVGEPAADPAPPAGPLGADAAPASSQKPSPEPESPAAGEPEGPAGTEDAATVAEEAAAAPTRKPTRTESAVLRVMSERVAMRKVDIAIRAGIGRGSCNRIVDRLVGDGRVREGLPQRYLLVPGRS